MNESGGTYQCIGERGCEFTSRVSEPGTLAREEEDERGIRYYCDLLHKLSETSCTVSLFKTSAVGRIVFMHFFKCLTLYFIKRNT